MKSNFQKCLLLIFSVSIGSSDPGDLIDYSHQNSLSLPVIEAILSTMGSTGSLPAYPISIYEIQYESHRPDGMVDTLAGLVCFPQSPTLAFPIISYQHGTTLLDDNAPSITGMTLDNPELVLIGLITSPSGFITLFPDYEGLGDPDKFHPYIVADSYTRAIVNMVRAVKQLSFILDGNDQFQFNDQLYLFGYSEGGYATLAAQRGFQLDYPDEFTITASCPMAGPYDLEGTMVEYFLSIPSYPKPYYVPYVLTSHLWSYQGLDVDFHEYFETFWADTLPSLYDGTHSGGDVDAIMPENPLDILLPEVLEDFTNNEDHFFRVTLAQNTLLDWAPESPTYLFHGIGDDIIPYENAQIAFDTFISNGAPDVTLTLFPEYLGGHGEVATTCLFAGYDVILGYQAISPKGDLNSDSFITNEDVNFLMESILIETAVTEFQWWAGDVDWDDTHSIFDLLLTSDSMDE